MANSFYARVKGFLAGTKARGSDVRFEYDAVEDAFDSVEAIVQTDGTLSQNLNGDSSTYKLTGMADGVDSQDYATIANVSAGGSPGSIPITSLGVGTATANQVITIDSGGTAVVGVDGVTGLNPGSATADQFLMVSSGGTAVIGEAGSAVADSIPVTSLGIGTATASQTLKVNSGGTAIVGVADANNKNFLINGDLSVAQQRFSAAGVTYTSTTDPANSDDTYLLDGWYLLSDGNNAYDISQSTASLPDGASNAWLFDVETVSKKGGMLQIIESHDALRLFNGGNGTCSLSFKALRTGADMEIKAAVLAWDSTADTVTSDVVSAWGADGTTPTFAANWTAENTPANLGLSTSWQTFTIENISLDTASTTNLAVFIWIDTTTANLGEYVYVTDVQLEDSKNASGFSREAYPAQLLRCQRFLRQWTHTNATLTIPDIHGYTSGSTTTRYGAPMNTRFRVAPTVAVSAASHWVVAASAAQKTATAISLYGTPSGESVELLFSHAAGSAAGRGASLYTNTSNAFLRLSSIL